MTKSENLVLLFLAKWVRPIRVGDLARKLGKNHSTMNSIIKRLERDGFVHWDPYKLVELSEKGKECASHLSLHHDAMETFLIKTLGLPEQQAHEEALKLAPDTSCKLIETICTRYENVNCVLDTSMRGPSISSHVAEGEHENE